MGNCLNVINCFGNDSEADSLSLLQNVEDVEERQPYYQPAVSKFV